MADEFALTLAGLLRQLRKQAGLTQEELAERASLSVRSVSDMERGITLTARRDTIRLLADALGLAGPERERFESVARGRPPGSAVAGATRTLPRDVASFTGRERELMQLAGTADVIGIHAIGGMAGVGKTAFAVHAAHQLSVQFPDGQIFLPLHGHTPGQQPVAPADALASLLQTAGVAAQQIPADTDARAALWRDYLADRRLLLVLDDAVDSDQVQPLLPGTGGSIVLVTSRRHLTALGDAQSISLDTLPPIEAAALLARLAARPGLEADDPTVREIARLCAYLPLAVGLMAGQLHHHPAWTAADMAAELATARDRLELMTAENLSVAAAFDLSYARLTGDQQRLFRRLGQHPGPDIDTYAAAALDPGDGGLAAARRGLRTLYDHHLLTEPVRGRYRLHDLIREHARTVASTDPVAERDAAAGRLLDYYLHVTLLADHHLIRRTPAVSPMAVAAPQHAPELATRPQAVAWLEAERLNIQGTAFQAARPGYVAAISASLHSFLRVQGHWDQALALHQLAIKAASQDRDRLAEAQARSDLATIQRMTGDYPGAAGNLTIAVETFRELGDRQGEANALLQLGNVQYPTGDYPEAVRSLGRALEHYRDLGDLLGEASALSNLGAVQALTGDLPAAAASLTSALDANRDLGDEQGQAHALNYLGTVQRMAGDYRAALTSQVQSLELHQQSGDRFGQASALNDLGAVQRITGDYAAATASQTRALELFRSVGHRLGQASALGDLGVVQTLTGDYPAAIDSLKQALELFTELGHRQGQASALCDLGPAQVLTRDHAGALESLNRALEIYASLGHRQGQAEVLNNMGEALLADNAAEDARARHQEALDIAVDIPAPAEEARAREGIGRCQLLAGHGAEGGRHLRQALGIYQRIKSTNAERVAALLRQQQR
jgi:tetratricopeptide (TPR) repeat protein/transcriptional regulator with XRE-family HTH domain